MKSRTLDLSLGLLCALLLAACASQNPAPPPAPTLPPTPTRYPVPKLPPAEGTITLEGGQCSYDGPQPIPAKTTFTVNWYVYDNLSSNYGLYVFIVGEGKTADDLQAALRLEGTPPDWLTQAGSFETGPNSSLQVTVKTVSGPLFGPLYFACFTTESSPPKIIGPLTVTGNTP
jgi:hypothetical protein